MFDFDLFLKWTEEDSQENISKTISAINEHFYSKKWFNKTVYLIIFISLKLAELFKAFIASLSIFSEEQVLFIQLFICLVTI